MVGVKTSGWPFCSFCTECHRWAQVMMKGEKKKLEETTGERGWEASMCAFMQHLLCARHCVWLYPQGFLPATGEEAYQRGEGTYLRPHSQEGVGSDGLSLGSCPNRQQPPPPSHTPTFTKKPWRQDTKRLETISWFVCLGPARIAGLGPRDWRPCPARDLQ